MQILKELNMEDMKNRKWTITACSAKTQEGLEDGLTWVVENVKKWMIGLKSIVNRYF